MRLCAEPMVNNLKAIGSMFCTKTTRRSTDFLLLYNRGRLARCDFGFCGRKDGVTIGAYRHLLRLIDVFIRDSLPTAIARQRKRGFVLHLVAYTKVKVIVFKPGAVVGFGLTSHGGQWLGNRVLIPGKINRITPGAYRHKGICIVVVVCDEMTAVLASDGVHISPLFRFDVFSDLAHGGYFGPTVCISVSRFRLGLLSVLLYPAGLHSQLVFCMGTLNNQVTFELMHNKIHLLAVT